MNPLAIARFAQSSALKQAGSSALSQAKQAARAYATAQGAWDLGKNTYNSLKRKAVAAPEPRAVRRTGMSGGAGYAGRFPTRVKRANPKRGAVTKRKSRRRRAPYKKRGSRARGGENYFAQYGAIATKEVSGTLTDGDCVYIGHSSLVPDECIRTVVYALVRALYKRAIGYEADNMKSVIPYKTKSDGSQVGNGHSIIIKYCTNMNLNTKDQSKIDITGESSTIVTVGDAIFGRFRDMSTASDTAKNQRLLWIEIVDDTTGHTRAHMDLTCMRVNLFTKSELKIQNVTIPEVTATTEDNVNNVPLVGRSYHMSHWCPKTTDDDNSYLDTGIQTTGMITWRANQTSGVQYEAWKEPPPSKSFTNCTASSKIRLEPGTIRNHVSSTRKSMLLEDFLIAMAYNSTSVSNRNPRLGTHDMFAMERLLQLEGVLPIKIVYECNNFTGAVVSSKRRVAIMQKVTYATQNSIP